jgi:hypothetical protein
MIESLYEELIMLCEIRGELDENSNQRTESRIREISFEIKQMEAESV